MSEPTHYHRCQFPPDMQALDWVQLVPLIGPAIGAITRFEGVLSGIPNSDVLLAPLLTNEAVMSSRIEGTQATLGEVLQFEATAEDDDPASANADIQEVLNYRLALRQASSDLEALPLSQRLVRNAHHVLMRGVRGQSKDPGNYQRIQNWIGAPTSTIDSARFVPCAPQELPSAMAAWESYLNAAAPDPLVQLAIIHAEFEAIHPFLDGNGRMGRLLIPLFLFERKILSRPNFYVSAFLEANRDEYYARLRAVSSSGDWSGWIKFFLHAVREQALQNVQKAEAILALYSERKDWVVTVTRSQYSVRALDFFFSRPIFETTEFIRRSGIPEATARRMLRVCRDEGLLAELQPASGQTPALFAFSNLLNIAEGRQAF